MGFIRQIGLLYYFCTSPYDYMNALTLQTHIMYHKFGPNHVYPKPNFNLCEGPLNPDLNLVPNWILLIHVGSWLGPTVQ